METVFNNGMYNVEADSAANTYRVTNVQTKVLEETTTILYDAIRYAVMYKNAITEIVDKGKDSTAWPAINKDSVN